MKRIAVCIVAVGLPYALILGYVSGFDGAAVGMFFFLALLGGLAIAVAKGKEKGLAAPAQCSACGGLMSPNAPYCKHCGEPVGA